MDKISKHGCHVSFSSSETRKHPNNPRKVKMRIKRMDVVSLT